MLNGSVDSFESFGLVDGPGIRSIIFLNGCMLRCKYCHNPEMWNKKENNFSSEEMFEKVKRCMPYFKKNGGVTFSGGEPLLQPDFVIKTSELLKNENIHIAIDTAGVGVGRYEEILKNVDLILFDVKHYDPDKYRDLVGLEMKEVFNFLDVVRKLNKKLWIRQVVVPGMMDNYEYLNGLDRFLKTYINIDNIERIDFLPYHTMAKEKYEKLGIDYPLKDLEEMDKDKCNELYKTFLDIYNKK